MSESLPPLKMTKPELTQAQWSALEALDRAHMVATDSGLFDILMSYTAHGDSINDVCEAVSSLIVLEH